MHMVVFFMSIIIWQGFQRAPLSFYIFIVLGTLLSSAILSLIIWSISKYLYVSGIFSQSIFIKINLSIPIIISIFFLVLTFKGYDPLRILFSLW